MTTLLLLYKAPVRYIYGPSYNIIGSIFPVYVPSSSVNYPSSTRRCLYVSDLSALIAFFLILIN